MSGSMKYSAVIFDLFGTLIENLRREKFEEMLSEMASVLSVPSQDFIRSWNDTWKERSTGYFSTLESDILAICRSLNARPEEALLLKAAEIGRGFARTLLMRPRETGLLTLSKLKEAGYRIGLISNCAANVPSVWPGTPLAPLIDVPVFSCSVGLMKPDPRIFLLVCQRLMLTPRRCVYVADGNEGELTGASKVGMRSVLFCGPDEDPYDEGQDRREWLGPTVFSLEEIPKLLNSA